MWQPLFGLSGQNVTCDVSDWLAKTARVIDSLESSVVFDTAEQGTWILKPFCLLMNPGAYWGIPLHYYDQFNMYNKETNDTD